MGINWSAFIYSGNSKKSMARESDDSQWAFDLRPWEGGRWSGDKGDPSLEELFPDGKMVHIGFRSQWNRGETSKQSWTEPITEGAEKAKHNAFNEFRYICCDHPDCGVRVSVVQAGCQAWHFRRQRPTRGSRKPQTCISEKHWAPETVFHSLTKVNIKRILMRSALREEFNVKHVQNETQVTFERAGEHIQFRPDVLVTLQDDSELYIEVVYTNGTPKLKHDLYGENLVIIDLTDEENDVGLDAYFEDDRILNFRRWVRNGGIEELLRRELSLERRRHAHRERETRYRDQNRTVESEFFQEIWNQVRNRDVYISPASRRIIEEALVPGMSKREIQRLFDDAIDFENVSAQKSLFLQPEGCLCPSRKSFFSKLVYVLRRADRFDGHEFNISLEDAEQILEVLENWHGMTHREQVILTDENNIDSKLELLNYLGLDEEMFIIDSLDDWTLLDDFYWKLLPREQFNYMLGGTNDPLYISVNKQGGIALRFMTMRQRRASCQLSNQS